MQVPLSTTLALAVVPALCLTACHKRKPAPSIDVLSAALERSAEQSLPAPTLANDQVILPAMPAQAGARAAEVLKAAAAAGGAAIRSLDAQGRISILATIPENNADAFKAALRHGQAGMQKPSASTLLIEVLIENPPSPSPAP